MTWDFDRRTREQVIADALRSYSRETAHTTRAKHIEAALQKWDRERPASNEGIRG